MYEVILKRFENPDETRNFEKGKFELVQLGGMTIGRATYEPGWSGRSMWARLRELRAAWWSMLDWLSRDGRRLQWMTGV
jgi:hypothetical protein